MGRRKPFEQSDESSDKNCDKNLAWVLVRKIVFEVVENVTGRKMCGEVAAKDLVEELTKEIVQDISVNKFKKVFKTPLKKVVINPELSPIEKIREQNIAERDALLRELGFCSDKKQVKPKSKTRPKLCVKSVVLRKSERIKNEK